jgi:hypothetical protein
MSGIEPLQAAAVKPQADSADAYTSQLAVAEER